MGYTHYWTFKKVKPIKGKQSQIEAQYQLAVRQCQRIVRSYNKTVKAIDSKHYARLAGYSAHTKVKDYLGLDFNGTAEMGHENFYLRDHWSQNESFNFCKTASKPYDVVVVACLITLKHYLGDLVEVGSDGNASDWINGLALAQSSLRMKLNIPAEIEREPLQVVSE